MKRMQTDPRVTEDGSVTKDDNDKRTEEVANPQQMEADLFTMFL